MTTEYRGDTPMSDIAVSDEMLAMLADPVWAEPMGSVGHAYVAVARELIAARNLARELDAIPETP